MCIGASNALLQIRKRIKLFVDGKLVASSSSFEPAEYDVSTDQPLRIGFGQTDYFAGRITDVRVYNRALDVAEIHRLAAQSTQAAKVQTAQIVLALGASRVDEFAAMELKRYLQKAFNWEVKITEGRSETVGGPVFFVGTTDSDVASGSGLPGIAATIDTLSDEGVALKGDGAHVALVGRGCRGGLYAVYEFLDKSVGCRWPEPGREYVPSRSSLNLKIDYVHNPSCAYRGVALHGPCSDAFYREIIDWLSKNRQNTLQFSCEVYDQLRPKILEVIRERGLQPKIGAHSRNYFYPSDKYFHDLPEHFALVKGKRTGDTQLCYSNHASAAEYAGNIIVYLKAHSEIGVVGLWPSDGYGFCECDRCKSQATTDVLLDYINDVAQRIHAESPQVKVEFLSYIHYTSPPEKVKPLPYVVPTYCEYWSRSQFHPITDERAANAKCRSQLEQWAKASHQATVYSYYADDTIKRFLYNPEAVSVRGVRVLTGNSKVLLDPSWLLRTPPSAPFLYSRPYRPLLPTLVRVLTRNQKASPNAPAHADVRCHQIPLIDERINRIATAAPLFRQLGHGNGCV